MKTARYIPILAAAAAALLAASCVKDTLYNTPHPDHGKIAVTADWSARGEGIDIPATWTVTMGDYTGTETSATRRLPPPMPPTTCSHRAATPSWRGTRPRASP